MGRLGRYLTAPGLWLSLASAAAAQTPDAPIPATEPPIEATNPGTETPTQAAPPPPVAQVAPVTAPPVAAPAAESGDVASELEDDQPGATDAILNGEALKIYGFGDVNYRQFLLPKSSPWLVYLNRHPSLFVGHLNFYFDSQLSERWRALAEVRFTYLPHGSWSTNSQGQVSHNDVHGADYMNITRDRPVGGLMIERAFIEYSAFPFLSVQIGQWLTPYGVWNVDHGSPVIIGVVPPYIIGSHLLPEAQVGLLAYGHVSLVEDLELGYALGLSNGRTDLIEYEDLDDNKAVTGRLSLTYRGAGELTLGSTFYAGTTTDNTRSVYFDDGAPKSRENIFYEMKERSFAFDLRWINGDFHFQAEAIINDRKFTERGRPQQNGGLEPNRRNAGGYALVGYRTPFAGIMPYVKGEHSPDPALQAVGVNQNAVLLGGGLNFRPVPRVVLKAEYTHGFFPGAKPTSFGNNPIDALESQIAWAF
jgi:hypothetical protein